jgi:hypothetical protein
MTNFTEEVKYKNLQPNTSKLNTNTDQVVECFPTNARLWVQFPVLKKIKTH